MSRFAQSTSAMLTHNIDREAITNLRDPKAKALQLNPITQADDSFLEANSGGGAAAVGGMRKRRSDPMLLRRTNPFGDDENGGVQLTADELKKLESASAGSRGGASVASSMGYSHRAQLPLPLDRRSSSGSIQSSLGGTSGDRLMTMPLRPLQVARGGRSASSTGSTSGADDDLSTQYSSASAFELECKINALEKALKSETIQRETAEIALRDIQQSVSKQTGKLLLSPAQMKRAAAAAQRHQPETTAESLTADPRPLQERSANISTTTVAASKSALKRPPLAPLKLGSIPAPGRSSSAMGQLLQQQSSDVVGGKKVLRAPRHVQFKSPTPSRTSSAGRDSTSSRSRANRSPVSSGSLHDVLRPASSLH